MSPLEIGVALCLFAIIGMLCAIRWRMSIRRESNPPKRGLEEECTRTISTETRFFPQPGLSTKPVALNPQAPHGTAPASNADGELDLQLLRFLSDELPGGLSRQIDLYLAAFNSDRSRARTIFATRDRKEIHRLAHRFIAHAGAVHCIPLHTIATTLQSRSALLQSNEFDQLMSEFDREFVILTKKLDALRVSTEPG